MGFRKRKFFSFCISASCLVLSAMASASESLPELASRSKTAPVPQRVQIGGTCGLYALGMVMDYWHTVSSSNPTFLVSDQDLKQPGYRFNFEPTSIERILPYVLNSHYSNTGEMFDALTLAKTAVHFGYQASLYSHATLQDIYAVLDRKHPAVVAFDVDYSGNPAVFSGMRAHYAVLEGYFDDQGTRYLVARHGWGGKKDYVWKADELLASMKNLKYTNYYDPASPAPAAIHLPPYHGRVDLSDTSQSLEDRMIEVVPLGQEIAGGELVSNEM